MISDTQIKIDKICNNMAVFLKEKNVRYGDSALNPCKIFSKVDASNSICIRLDDKLNRLMNSTEIKKNDVSDLIGYLVLYCVSKDWTDFKEFLD